MATFKLETKVETNLLTKRGHNKLMNDLHRKMGERHKKVIMPKHFAGAPETVPGGGGYKFQRRSKKWNERKVKEGKPTTPLVYTGEMRSKVLGSSVVRATAKRWTITARGSYPMTAQRRHEVEALTPREIKQAAKMMEKLYPRLARLRRYKEFRRKR